LWITVINTLKVGNSRVSSLSGKMHELQKARSFLLIVNLNYGLKNSWENAKPSPRKNRLTIARAYQTINSLWKWISYG